MLSGIVFYLIFYAFLALLEGMISKISFLVCPNKWVLFCHLIFSPPPQLGAVPVRSRKHFPVGCKLS